MQKKIFVLMLSLVVLVFFLYFQNIEKTVIVAGTANPGKIMIYSFDGNRYKSYEIDTGYNLVWTVRIGDIYNRGKNVIVAGVGNSFFSTPFGCSLVAYEPTANGWKKDVIDSNVDIRCKDVAIGDVYNNGRNEIVLGTHGEGFVKVYKWDGTKWNSETLEDNLIATTDAKLGMNHRVPTENLTYNTTDQTAVHIVKIGDVDNDGKNEIVATISSSNEYQGNYSELAFLRMYKWNGSIWIKSDIDELTGIKFRATPAIGDAKNAGEKQLYVTGAPHLLLLYNLKNGNWTRSVIENQTQSSEINMKAMDISKIENKIQIIVATGVTNAVIYSYGWDGSSFEKHFIANISEILQSRNVSGLGDNSLSVHVADLNNDGKNEIVVGGESDTSANTYISAQDKLGWEVTPYGFLVVYKYSGNNWKPEILNENSVLGMDAGKLQIFSKS